jgi:chromosome segregation ATPase
MKKALFVVPLIALSLVLFLAVGYAQQQQQQQASQTPSGTSSDLLKQEISSMESVFGNLQSFMAQLVTEIKGNMAGVSDLNTNLSDLHDVVNAITVELKSAEGKIVGLQDTVQKMGGVQQATQDRLAKLESSLSTLSDYAHNCCDNLSTHLASLTDQVNQLLSQYNASQQDYAAFKKSITGDISALDNRVTALENEDIAGFKSSTTADISSLKAGQADLDTRVKALESEDVGTFKKKVLEMERSMSALAIKIDNNRTKLEGFDQAFAGLSGQIQANQAAIAKNEKAISAQEARLSSLEGGSQLQDLKDQVSTLTFVSVVALLAGIGALVWGFLGQ